MYCIGILDFTFDVYVTEPERSEYLHTIKLKNQHEHLFYDKLTYVYVEMPNFIKTESALESRLDKWLYFIKHLEDFQSIPAIFSDKVFEQAFEKAELSNLGQNDLYQYENSLKVFRDLENTIDYAFNEGRETAFGEGVSIGKIEGKNEIAKQAKQMGLSTFDISKLTGLSEEEIEGL